MKLNKMIDHTKLGANVSLEQINKLVDEAKVYDFKSVCVNPIWVNYAKQELKNTDVLVCTVIGFPHGTHQPEVKAFEALEAVKNGADELDMVINVYALKSHQDDLVKKDIEGIVKAGAGRTVKVILETCYLTAEEIQRGSKIAVSAGAHFEVKASGGVRTYDDAMKMIEAGATRIGTSNGVDIVSQRRDQSDSNTSY